MNYTDQFGIVPVTDDMDLLFPENDMRRTRIGRVCFVLIRQGGARVEIDGNGMLLHEGSFVFLLPNVLLHGLSHTEDFRFGYVFFDFDYLSDFPLLLKPDISDRAINAPCRNLDAETFHLMDNYFDFIGKRHRKGENCQAVTKGLLFALVMEVSRFYAEGSAVVEVPRQDELADRFFRLLHVYYKVEHGAAFYAGRLCVSDKHLMRTVKRKTGRTFHFWLSDFLIREAKLQLKTTDKSITEISEELRFPDSSFFARFFRKHTGVSPLQFRKG